MKRIKQPLESSSSPETPSSAGDAPKKWVTQFGSWGDYEAGVRLVEDRQNRRMVITFEEKPSEPVRTLMKSEQYGYRFDPQDKDWYKPINPAKPRQAREEAEDLVLQVTNLIRQEKGLEPRKSFSIAM